MIRRRTWARAVLTAAVPVVLCVHSAHADEPVAASEPRLLSETAEVTSVVDAFDRDDPFDLHIFAGFQQMWKRADIHRETELSQPGLSTGGFVPFSENVAAFSQNTSLLNLGVDIGIFRDLAIVFRLPIILSDSRELTDLDGSSRNPERLNDPTGEPIFKVPFTSPTRSGIDYLAVGLNWAVLNQQRDVSKPTWVIGVEGRFGVGTPLHACNANPSRIDPRTGKTSEQCPDPVTGAARDPGISRGMYSIVGKSIISKRFGWVEPYTGFDVIAEFPRTDSDFGASNNLRGSLLNHPPIVGTFTIGLEVIPWERREGFQRLVFDFRIQGIYNSPGREYSELFDALGSSTAPTLATPNPGGYVGGPNGTSVVDPSAQKVYFAGITDQAGYGAFNAMAGVTWQAGEYIKFGASGGVRFNESHLITAGDPCNPNVALDQATSGPCRAGDASTGSQRVTGIPNPNYRAIIDSPTRRFTVDNTVIGTLMLSGTVMF
ncbi:hypothetical protein BH09MYX1_BH09MYX1_64120 [soil metagenome]